MASFYNTLSAEIREYVEELNSGDLDNKCHRIINKYNFGLDVTVEDLIGLLTPTEQAIFIRMWNLGWIPSVVWDVTEELELHTIEDVITVPTFKCNRETWMYEQRPSAVFMNVYDFRWGDVISATKIKGNMNFVNPLWDTARQIGRAYAQLPFWTIQMNEGVVTLVRTDGKRFIRPSVKNGLPHVEESTDGHNWKAHGMSAKPLSMTQVVAARDGSTGVFIVEGDTYPYRSLFGNKETGWGGEWQKISKTWKFVNPSADVIALLNQLIHAHMEAGARTWTKYHIIAKLLIGGRATLIVEDRDEQERLFTLMEDAFYRETWQLSGYDYHDYNRAYQFWQETENMPVFA
jgi:hypothetical protein